MLEEDPLLRIRAAEKKTNRVAAVATHLNRLEQKAVGAACRDIPELAQGLAALKRQGTPANLSWLGTVLQARLQMTRVGGVPLPPTVLLGRLFSTKYWNELEDLYTEEEQYPVGLVLPCPYWKQTIVITLDDVIGDMPRLVIPLDWDHEQPAVAVVQPLQDYVKAVHASRGANL